jgi:hypothetical protein
MKPEIFRKFYFVMLCAFIAIFLVSCDDSADDDSLPVTPAPVTLAYSVYAGEDADGKWATFAFMDEDTVYYFPDNAAHYDWTYSYNETGKSGFITKQGSSGAAPGEFTLSDDEKFIIFGDYCETQGQRQFSRVRDKDVVDDPVPFSVGALPADIDGTVWAATAYRTRDWTTLTVTATDGVSGTIDVAHSFDCTSYPRAYSAYAYDTQTTLYYVGPFKIDENGFTFLNFYGHGVPNT